MATNGYANMDSKVADLPIVNESEQLPPCLAARLSREESVVDMFRPLDSGSSTPATPSPEWLGKKASRELIRDAADDYYLKCKDRVHTPHVGEKELRERFAEAIIPDEPISLQAYLQNIVPSFVQDSTRVSCSRQIGHMTGSLPNYLPPLAELVTAMNQNVVKSETSKTVTLLEKQVTACIHRLIYDNEEKWYSDAIKDTENALGMFCSGGTIANITGLWVARNSAFPPDPKSGFHGCEQSGLLAAALHYGYKGVVVIGSALMHYSFKKATDVLGLGVQGLVTVPYDKNYRVKIEDVENKILECKMNQIKVIAVVGVAGATETGSVDDLAALAAISQEHGIHFHVDAAWGGPALFSQNLKTTMKGIESADSVTIDGHKQLFMPMGCGMLLLRDPSHSQFIDKTANYIIRAGSSDLGRFTLEGSRPANSIYMHANLSCIGNRGYEALMDRSVRVCRYMAQTLRTLGCFQVLFEPMMNILLYRYVPKKLRAQLGDRETAASLSEEEWAQLDEANCQLQDRQKAEGNTFVSRTTVFDAVYDRRLVALRVVIGNPVTEERDIDAVIADQLRLLEEDEALSMLNVQPARADDSMELQDEPSQDEYWRKYWNRMPQTAKQFFLDDSARFRASLIAPSAPSALAQDDSY